MDLLSHFGSKVPPIIKKTVHNESHHILNKLLLLNGEVTLNNHIILVEESSEVEVYLGPKLLIPDSPQLLIKYQDQNITTLSFKSEQTFENSSSEDSDDNDIAQTPASGTQKVKQLRAVCDKDLLQRVYNSDKVLDKMKELAVNKTIHMVYFGRMVQDSGGFECSGGTEGRQEHSWQTSNHTKPSLPQHCQDVLSVAGRFAGALKGLVVIQLWG